MAATTKPTVEKPRPKKLYERIANKLERWILNELKAGDKLPSERQLAPMFRVGRSSIRDAVRKLETVGLLECRHGLGMIVRNVSGDSLLNPIAEALVRERHHIEELLEVRHMIEPGLAARAAVHCRSEQLAALELILQRQQEKVCRGNLPVEDDIEFHYVIARAADNSVLLKIYEILMEQLRKMRERSLQVRGREKISFLGHRRIMEALRSRDSHAADLAMRRHLQEIGNVILRGAR